MVKVAPLSAADIVDAVAGAVLSGDDTRFEVTELGEPLEVGSNGLAFVIAESYLKDVPMTKAAILVVQAAFAERVKPLLPVGVRLCVSSPDAYLGFANVTRIVAERDFCADWRLSAKADRQAVSSAAKIDSTAQLGPGVIVGERAQIGPRTTVLGSAVIGPEVQIGADCVVFPGVVLYPRTVIGNRVRLHANVVLGADGFGYARGSTGSVKIWHLGRVVIGDDVEVGAGTTIDRGTIRDSIVENGVKIDNLCQLGHNSHVKSHAILCAQVGMAGNVTVGRGAILAGKAGVADKVEIGDGALVGPMTGLSKDVKPGEQIMGQQPGKPRREWWRLVVLFEKLPELYDRVKKLEARRANDS